MKSYLFEYRHDGAEWAFELTAESEADARARLKALGWAQYRGEIKARVRVPGGDIALAAWRWAQGAVDNIARRRG